MANIKRRHCGFKESFQISLEQGCTVPESSRRDPTVHTLAIIQEQINCCFTITQPTHKFFITHSHHSSFSLHSKQHNTAVKLPGSCWNCHKSVGDSYYIYFKADRKVSGGIAATRQICRQGDGAARSGCPSL